MTAATPYFPKGTIEHCNKCFMVGSEIGCAHCDDGMHVDPHTGMCVKWDDKKHEEHVEVQTNIIPCPGHMEHGCQICVEGEVDLNGAKHMVQQCLVCREGFVKGNKGGCYSEQDRTAGEECPLADRPHGCMNCR